MTKPIAIVGNGIAGITTARHVRKRSDQPIVVISAESDHFYSRTALMYIYMGHMKYEHTKPYEDWFWKKNKIDLVNDLVTEVDVDNKRLILADGAPIEYDKLVLATGAKPNKFGWPGQDLDGVQGLYSLQDLATLEKNTPGTKHAVIVGGGLIGVELSEMLHTRGIHVTFLVRESYYWGNVLRREESEMIGRHLAEFGVDLRLNTELDRILADENGRARAVVTKDGEEIACQLVGLTAGVSPNIGFLKDSSIQTGRGIVVNRFLETNIPNVYAAGDCAEIREEGQERGMVEQLWYTGRMQGEVLGKTLTGERTRYDRGIWFNSAKFYDIEYHTYGVVWPKDREGETSFYWEHPNGKISIRFVYDEKDHRFIGMNSFGIRYRHQVFEKWLADNRSLEYVLEHLHEANFDPEFFDTFENVVTQAFNTTHKASLTPPPKRKKVLGIF